MDRIPRLHEPGQRREQEQQEPEEGQQKTKRLLRLPMAAPGRPLLPLQSFLQSKEAQHLRVPLKWKAGYHYLARPQRAECVQILLHHFRRQPVWPMEEGLFPHMRLVVQKEGR